MIFNFPINYDYPLYRPPSEANSLIFQVTIGCSWNRCSFCEMYTSKQFRARKETDVFEEIETAALQFRFVKKIFLGDGNAMVLSTKRLLKTLEKINQSFPALERVSVYALPKDLYSKSRQDLEQLKNAGLKLVYVGIESGDETVLKKIQKNETPATTIKGLQAAREAGIQVSTMIVNGLGGKKYMEQHAINSAKVLNETQPDFASTLVLNHPQGPERFLKTFGDDYQPLSLPELFEEMKLLIGHTQLENTVFRSNHASNLLILKGTLSKDKGNFLNQIEQAASIAEDTVISDLNRGL